MAKSAYLNLDLIEAIERQDADEVAYALSKGADPNFRSANVASPLHIVGYPPLVELLVAAGADVNYLAPGGTPLLYAINRKNLRVVKALVEHGADIHRQCLGANALLHAAATNDHEIFAFLVEQGARIESTDCKGSGVLHRSRSPLILEQALAAGLNINATNADGATPLLAHCLAWRPALDRSGLITAYRWLINHGADPFFRNNQQVISPLEIIASDIDFSHGATLINRILTKATPEQADIIRAAAQSACPDNAPLLRAKLSEWVRHELDGALELHSPGNHSPLQYPAIQRAGIAL